MSNPNENEEECIYTLSEGFINKKRPRDEMDNKEFLTPETEEIEVAEVAEETATDGKKAKKENYEDGKEASCHIVCKQCYCFWTYTGTEEPAGSNPKGYSGYDL